MQEQIIFSLSNIISDKLKWGFIAEGLPTKFMSVLQQIQISGVEWNYTKRKIELVSLSRTFIGDPTKPVGEYANMVMLFS